MKSAALERGLTVRTPEKLDAAEREAIAALGADAFAVASYGKILPASLLAQVPIAFNVHPSLLPLYRGATPLQSAIRDGRRETGVTIIAMDAGMDTGDILLQERTPLGASETYGELHDRLAADGARLLREAIERAQNGTLARTPQAGLARESEIAATLTRPWRGDDFTIDWSWPAARIVDLVRALAPAPSARAAVDDDRVKVLAARHGKPGEMADPLGLPVRVEGDAVLIGCGDGTVAIERLTPPNRAPMSGAAYARLVTAPPR